MSDRGLHFLNEFVYNLLNMFMVVHNKLAPYHPQANRQAKSTNKILKIVLTKIVNDAKTNWELKLHSTFWA